MKWISIRLNCRHPEFGRVYPTSAPLWVGTQSPSVERNKQEGFTGQKDLEWSVIRVGDWLRTEVFKDSQTTDDSTSLPRHTIVSTSTGFKENRVRNGLPWLGWWRGPSSDSVFTNDLSLVGPSLNPEP